MKQQIDHTHPHAIIGEFVYQWDTFIRKGLESGDNLDVTMGVIGDVVMRGVAFERRASETGTAVYANYRTLLALFRGIFGENRNALADARLRKHIIDITDRRVGELDLLLREDINYESQRQQTLRPAPRK